MKQLKKYSLCHWNVNTTDSACKDNNVTCEQGRSMVEMLGTLAIIGVLSIGGIAGYSYGMDKYRANTVMNDVMLRAVDVISKSNTGNITLSDWPTTTGANWTIGLEENTNGIQVSGVPQRVCQMIFDGLIYNAAIKISGTQYDTPTNDVCADDNTMVFYVDEDILNNDLSGGGNTTTTTQKPEETKTCAASAYTSDECNNENNFYVDITDDCEIKKHNESCPNRELTGDYSIKKCNLADWYANGNSCPTKTETTTTTTTTLVPEESEVVAVQCEWTEWINWDRPLDDAGGVEGGDIETVHPLICKKEYIQDIECRAAQEPLSWEILGQVAQCDKEVGFVCKNSDQFGSDPFGGLCYDYEIRVFCCQPAQ